MMAFNDLQVLPNALASELQRQQLDLLKRRHERHLASHGSDSALEARIDSFEMAFRMRSEALEVMDIGRDSAATHAACGHASEPTDEFGYYVAENKVGFRGRWPCLWKRLARWSGIAWSGIAWAAVVGNPDMKTRGIAGDGETSR